MPTSVSLKPFSAALSRLIRLMPAPSTVTKAPALGLVEVKPDEHGATVSYRRGSYCLDCSVEGVEVTSDFMVDGRDLLKVCRTVEELPVLEPVDGVLVPPAIE